MSGFAVSVAVCFGAHFYEVTEYREPDHLIPIRDRHDYEKKIEDCLFVSNGSIGRMVIRPSFTKESCLAINEHENNQYSLTVTSPSRSIYDSLPENRRSIKEPDIKVQRTDQFISLELAIAIQRVWGKALQRTRYPSGCPSGLDGTTYEFSVWVRGLGYLRGQTWSPERGVPADLVSVGNELIAFTLRDDRGKTITERSLINKLRRLEARIPKA